MNVRPPVGIQRKCVSRLIADSRVIAWIVNTEKKQHRKLYLPLRSAFSVVSFCCSEGCEAKGVGGWTAGYLSLVNIESCKCMTMMVRLCRLFVGESLATIVHIYGQFLIDRTRQCRSYNPIIAAHHGIFRRGIWVCFFFTFFIPIQFDFTYNQYS